MIRHRALLALSFLACVGGAARGDAAARDAADLLGFLPSHAPAQLTLEARFDSSLQRDELRPWMQHLSARPHHLGSPYDKENAEFIAGLFRSWGYDTRIEEFRVLFPTPKLRKLEMTAPQHFTAALDEPAVPGDATSRPDRDRLPPYNAYSIDGDVTGELVYVNFGVQKDYEELERRGIDVRGKIVLARYGGAWRGIKPKVAAERGAVGCIIYSDPREDGYFQGDPYPKGGWRNADGAQRGSVADMPLHPGDPLTPGVGATPGAPRLDRSEAETLTKIPVLPISAADALPLLRALGGPMAPEAWRGALPLPYHVGPGPAVVHLQLAFDWNQVPAYDVIATLAGADLPDEWVVRGNHHDAWAYGATDPVSGLVALLEEAHGVAALARGGWRPRRTIVYAAWDGEEPGLLGSTEWVETHADELRRKAVLYINSDSNSRGLLGMSGSHTLEAFMNQVARDVVDPEKGIDVQRRARSQIILNGTAEARKEARERADLRLGALGSGSDYTPFLQHLGVASLNLGYGGEDEYGQYHSIYDSFDHYTRFGDPGFDYGVTLAQTAGRAVLRFADADVLPVVFGGLADVVNRYVKDVAKLADDMRDETAERNCRIEEGTYQAFFDPKETFVAPKSEPPVPFLNFAPLQNAAAKLQESATAFDKALHARLAGEEVGRADSAQTEAARTPLPPPDPTALGALDAALQACDRSLTRPAGLPGHPWFQHFIYAPGLYTGYGVKTLPAVREAIEQRRWQEAEGQVDVTARVLENCAACIDAARQQLGGDSGR
jgi:N-acetylated-alpha-linked acidic dipeptidase